VLHAGGLSHGPGDNAFIGLKHFHPGGADLPPTGSSKSWISIWKDQGTIELRWRARAIFALTTSVQTCRCVATLESLSFVPGWRITALRGGIGCGKSTVLSLMQRLYSLSKAGFCRRNEFHYYFRSASLRRAVAVVASRPCFCWARCWRTSRRGVSARFGALSGSAVNRCPGDDRATSAGFFYPPDRNGVKSVRAGAARRPGLGAHRDAPILLLDEPSLGAR